jgi:hypothetical protein
LFIAVWLAGAAQADPVGMFTDVKDVGEISRKTEASFEPETGTYLVSASGANIWAESDAFGFAWKPTNGDVSMSAQVDIQGKEGRAHRKAGVMFRQTLDANSPYVDAVVHGDGLTSLQFRADIGGPTREIQCARQSPSALKLEKRGDYVYLHLADVNGRFEPSGCVIKVLFRGVFYAGLAVCAHDNNAMATARFRHVTLGTLPKRSDLRTSAIEIVPVGSMDRRVVYASKYRLDTPSFTGAGNAICFREEGRLMYFSLTANTDPHLVGEENADECAMAIPLTRSPFNVSHEIKGGRAQIFRKGGGAPKPTQLTKDQFSNWAPRLSPDGSSMVFVSGTAEPVNGKPANGDYLLRQLPVDGGEPRELARFYGGPGTLGPGAWSTDGKQLVFMTREPD